MYEIIPDQPGTGKSQAKLTTDFWKWANSIPADKNPFNDTTGELADVNQSGNVFFLTGALSVPGGEEPVPPGTTREIDVPKNKEIFVPVANTLWDNAQLQGFFSDALTGLPDNGVLTGVELRNLNESIMETTTNLFFEVDGDTLIDNKSWGDPSVEIYRQVTPTENGFNYQIPEENVLGLPLEATDNGQGLVKNAYSDGIWFNLEFEPGAHAISFGGQFNLGSINVDLDGDGNANELGKEKTYQDIFSALGEFALGVDYEINQL